MITPKDKSALLSMFQSNGWRVFEQISRELQDKYNRDTVVRDSEWETIKTALMNEGMVRGIGNLLQELMNQAHE